jgi:hypothetical protein
MRKVTAILTALSMVATMTPVYGSTNGSAVVSSGDNNTVNSVVNDTSVVTVTQTNNTNVSQFVGGNVNTGNNTANRNISTGGTGTSINTGDAGMSVTNQVNAGSNQTVVTGANAGAAANLTEAVISGDDNTVNTVTNVLDVTAITNTNNTNVAQKVYGDVNTGNNTANRNIGNGTSVNTGNAGFSTGLEVNAGSNAAQVGGHGFGIAGSAQNGLSVTTTGDNNVANSVANTTTVVAVNNTNNTAVKQFVRGNVNTGWNRANRNIGDTDITTGEAALGAGVAVNAGQNAVSVGGVMPMGLSLSEVISSGDDLLTNTVTNTTMTTAVTGTNNLTEWQHVWGNTNTGWNYAKRSIGGSGIMTGGTGFGVGLGVNAGVNQTLIGGGLLGGLTGWFGAWWL